MIIDFNEYKKNKKVVAFEPEPSYDEYVRPSEVDPVDEYLRERYKEIYDVIENDRLDQKQFECALANSVNTIAARIMGEME